MPIAPTALVHVVYRTRRFEEMLAWYATVFGARIQYRNPALAFLTFDDEHHRFAFADLSVIRPEEDDKDDRGMIGVDHVAWEYGSLRDLLENYAELKAKGIAPYWAVHHGMTAIALPAPSIDSNSDSAFPPRNLISQSPGSYSTPTGFLSIRLP